MAKNLITQETADSLGVALENLSNPMWRIFSGELYKIIIKDENDPDAEGTVLAFKPNRAQRRFVARLWYRNIILKARQLGFCLDPKTRVLTADLRWVEIAQLKEGDEVVSVDEFPTEGRGRGRKMRTAVVEAVAEVNRKAYRISFDDGRSVVCTAQHPWLSKKTMTQASWRSIDGTGNAVVGRLKVGTKVRWITKPWGESSYEDGWFGGMLDGEGSISKKNTSAGVNVSQREGGVWQRLIKYAQDNNYNYRVENDKAERPTKYGKVPVPKLAFGRMDEMFRLIGKTRPTRFLGNRFWEDRELSGKKTGIGWATITNIEELEDQTMIDLQTSTGTYIAEGFVSHNTTLILIVWLDHAMFNSNARCGMIAQDDGTAQNIFRDKVKFVYDHLPDALKLLMPLKNDNAHELIFAHNNSSIRVATSMRSGTYHRLHVSEFGKICAKFPAKAKEVITGSIPSVPKTGVLIIESTAEGQDGPFYNLTQAAIKLFELGKKLTNKQYRFHFFGWFDDKDYRMSPKGVLITDKDHQYFDSIETTMRVSLDIEQRAWYVSTRQEFADAGEEENMLQEYPSCISGDTYISTKKGFTRLKDLIIDGEQVLNFFNKGMKQTYEITTKLGYSLVCTDDHPILCEDGIYRNIKEFKENQIIQLGKPVLGSEYQLVTYKPNRIATATVTIDEDFAKFIGIFMGDGSFHKDGVSIACDIMDKDTHIEVERLMIKYLGAANSRITGANKGCLEFRCSNIVLKDVFFALDLIRQNTSFSFKRKIHIPEYIMRSPKSVVASFLSGLFEADGFAARNGANVKFFSKCGNFCHDVQLLLLSFGIESSVKCRTKKAGNGSNYEGWELSLRANGTRTFAKEIKFISLRKQSRAELSLNKKKMGSNANFKWLDSIDTILPAGEKEVFDITTDTHNFIAGGIIVHNCPKEAFQVSLAGTYYAQQMTLMRKQNRICRVPILNAVVNTFWDIGGTAGTAIWVIQQIGLEHRAIDYYEAHNETFAHAVRWLESKDYFYNKDFLPHDAAHKRQLGNVNKSPEEMLNELGRKNTVIVPVIESLDVGIELTRKYMTTLWIDEENCVQGIKRLDGYKRKWDSTQGTWRNEPEKNDGNSEGADALRQWAQALDSKLITVSGNTSQKRKSGNWKTA